MTEKYFFFAIVSLSVTLTLRYLNKATAKSVSANEQGEFLLRMHKLYNIVGYFGLAFCLIITIGPFLSDEPDTMMYVLIIIMFIIFGGLGFLCILYYRNHYIRFDEVKIEVRNVYGKTKAVNWDSLQKARFNPSSGLLTLTDNNGRKVKIHQHLVGLKKFIIFLESKTKWTSKELKIPVNRN